MADSSEVRIIDPATLPGFPSKEEGAQFVPLQPTEKRVLNDAILQSLSRFNFAGAINATVKNCIANEMIGLIEEYRMSAEQVAHFIQAVQASYADKQQYVEQYPVGEVISMVTSAISNVDTDKLINPEDKVDINGIAITVMSGNEKAA